MPKKRKYPPALIRYRYRNPQISTSIPRQKKLQIEEIVKERGDEETISSWLRGVVLGYLDGDTEMTAGQIQKVKKIRKEEFDRGVIAGIEEEHRRAEEYIKENERSLKEEGFRDAIKKRMLIDNVLRTELQLFLKKHSGYTIGELLESGVYKDLRAKTNFERCLEVLFSNGFGYDTLERILRKPEEVKEHGIG